MAVRWDIAALCAIVVPVAAVLLAGGIRSLVRVSWGGEIAALPVVAEQKVFLDQAGEIDVAIRTMAGRRGYGGIAFALRSAGTAEAAPGRALVLRSRAIDLKGRATVSLHRFAVPAPGAYVLTADGLRAGWEDSDDRLVLGRPRGAATFVRILWVLVASGALIVAVVFGSLALMGKLP